MQPQFTIPDFLENNSANEIHQRMMNNLPADIDDMPGGFPYDFTYPAALEKEELINFHLVRALMISFPQYAWGGWLDLHGQQTHTDRNPPASAYGKVTVTGTAGIVISAGTVFCTPATDTGPSIEFISLEDVRIGEDGTAGIPVEAVESGTGSNVAANTVTMMQRPSKYVTSVTNPEPIRGGTEQENDDDYYDRIAAEYKNSKTYLGNDADYERWAGEAGAGDCIVISAAEGPGTVKLVLVDGNGQPANEKLVEDVYNHIVSPDDRSRRLLPTACAKLICIPATTVRVDFLISGIMHDETTNIEKIKSDFQSEVKAVYAAAKQEGILRYNDVRPIIKRITGLLDFAEFLMDGDMKNIQLGSEEYLETGDLDFS